MQLASTVLLSFEDDKEIYMYYAKIEGIFPTTKKDAILRHKMKGTRRS